MTYEERVVRRSDDRVDPASNVVVERHSAVNPSGGEMARRVIVLIFGIIQALIAMRRAPLLLDAREANALVAFILNASQLLVPPFEGVFRTNSLT